MLRGEVGRCQEGRVDSERGMESGERAGYQTSKVSVPAQTRTNGPSTSQNHIKSPA